MAEPWLQALSGSEDALAAALVAACEEQSELSELVAHAAEQAQ
jgi:siroheme synthase (precorrin-2 oxidase/ferrochelatase)